MSEMTTAEMVRSCQEWRCLTIGISQEKRDLLQAIAARLSALDKELTERNLSTEYSSPSVMVRRIAVERDELRTQLAAATARAEKAEAEREKLLAAMRVIDTMPVDGCTPSVIESMLRQAKTLAYNAHDAARREAKDGR